MLIPKGPGDITSVLVATRHSQPQTFSRYAPPVANMLLTVTAKLQCLQDGNVVVYDVVHGETVEMIVAHQNGPCRCVKFSADNKEVLSCGADSKVVLWDWRKRSPLRIYSGHFISIGCCDISSNVRRGFLCPASCQPPDRRHAYRWRGFRLVCTNTGMAWLSHEALPWALRNTHVLS